MEQVVNHVFDSLRRMFFVATSRQLPGCADGIVSRGTCLLPVSEVDQLATTWDSRPLGEGAPDGRSSFADDV